jgi:lipoprotein-anchoring transpeptidase ErfK/SrfK
VPHIGRLDRTPWLARDKDSWKFGLGEGVARKFNRVAAGCGALVAGLAITLSSTTPAPAYQGWFLFGPPASIMEPERPRPTVNRRAIREQKARKLLAEKGAPERLPPGPLHIVISIKKQQLTLYAGGVPVAHSRVSTGVPGHPTPQGVFSILEKRIYHESNIYSSAPMPFMQRITWSGVAMHQGVVPNHPASHGCIRLPPEFARRMWGITKIGARVIIAQDDVPLAEISNKRLFTALPQVTAEAEPAKVRFATSTVTDAPLKGSIHAVVNDAARAEQAIDQMVQTGAAEAEAYVAQAPAPAHLIDKPAPAPAAKDPMLRPGPISVYISGKLGKLFVRKGFTEVFETPVTIARPDEPLGTHLFTALEGHGDGTMRWNVASLPIDRVVKPGKYQMTYTARGEKLRKELMAPEYQVVPAGDPNAALDRITIPQDALARINELMTQGASLIISDLGLSHETGRGTDFIVLTR